MRENNAALMQMRAPIDGIVVFNTIWKQGKMGEVQEGDQVRPGVPFMQVVNPALMQVHVSVNQEDLMALNLGQTAQVHLDAYPGYGASKGGWIQLIPWASAATSRRSCATFLRHFPIQGNDTRLMPDLSAAVDVGRERHAHVGEVRDANGSACQIC